MHGDPINGIDPSGKFFSIAGVFAGLALSSALSGRYNANSVQKGFVAGGLAVDLLMMSTIIFFNSTKPISRLKGLQGKPQLPEQRYESSLQANTNYLRVENSTRTAREVFDRLLEFDKIDYRNSNITPSNGVSGVGDRIQWTLDFPLIAGQFPFDVDVDQVDVPNRRFSVVTLGGHPLSGFRFWEVEAASDSSTTFTIRTGAVEHDATGIDWIKAKPLLGDQKALQTWEGLLNSLAIYTAGDIDFGNSNIQGGFDQNLIPDFKQKVQFRYRD